VTSAARFFRNSVLPRFSRKRRLGVAIGPEILYVAQISGSESVERGFMAWAVRLQRNLLDPAADSREVIRSALEACPYLSPGSSDLLHVVILPPLALGRRVSLPRLTKAEYRQILARDATRYFATDRASRVVGVVPFAGRHTSPIPIFAASASAEVVDAVGKSVGEFGGELASLDCAYASWTGAAVDIWPSLARAKSAVIVCQPDVTEVIYANGESPEMVRRVSANAPISQLLDAIGMNSEAGPARTVAILGSAEKHEEWGSILSAAGVAVLPGTATSRLDGGTLAAIYAAGGTGPGLYPEHMYSASRNASQRMARRFGIFAVAASLLSAALLLIGTRRELGVAVAERSAIRADVSKALGIKSDISAVEARSAMIASLSSATPRWSAILASITEALPADAYLTSVWAQADTVVLEGQASRAASVFEALQRDTDLTAVHSSGPVRQQLQDGSPVEHFAVTARLAPPARGRGAH
jgi:Tfp pilus assembly protein PilN